MRIDHDHIPIGPCITLRIKVYYNGLIKHSHTTLVQDRSQKPVLLKGILSKNLQKPYICGRGGYNSWGDGTYYVDTLGPTKTHTPLGRILQVFINKAF